MVNAYFYWISLFIKIDIHIYQFYNAISSLGRYKELEKKTTLSYMKSIIINNITKADEATYECESKQVNGYAVSYESKYVTLEIIGNYIYYLNIYFGSGVK